MNICEIVVPATSYSSYIFLSTRDRKYHVAIIVFFFLRESVQKFQNFRDMFHFSFAIFRQFLNNYTEGIFFERLCETSCFTTMPSWRTRRVVVHLS